MLRSLYGGWTMCRLGPESFSATAGGGSRVWACCLFDARHV